MDAMLLSGDFIFIIALNRAANNKLLKQLKSKVQVVLEINGKLLILRLSYHKNVTVLWQ